MSTRNEFMDHGYGTCAKLNNIYMYLLKFLQCKKCKIYVGINTRCPKTLVKDLWSFTWLCNPEGLAGRLHWPPMAVTTVLGLHVTAMGHASATSSHHGKGHDGHGHGHGTSWNVDDAHAMLSHHPVLSLFWVADQRTVILLILLPSN